MISTRKKHKTTECVEERYRGMIRILQWSEGEVDNVQHPILEEFRLRDVLCGRGRIR